MNVASDLDEIAHIEPMRTNGHFKVIGLGLNIHFGLGGAVVDPSQILAGAPLKNGWRSLALGRLGAKRFGLRLAHLRLLEEIHGGAASASICRFRKLTLVCLRFRLCAMAAALYTVAGILFEATSKLLLGT
jgi:hypothetical protein